MYGWYGDGGVWGWVAMGVMMLLFWGGIIAVVLLLIRGARGGGQYPGPYGGGFGHDEAERILNERFARGEIDETEFQARRSALRRRP